MPAWALIAIAVCASGCNPVAPIASGTIIESRPVGETITPLVVSCSADRVAGRAPLLVRFSFDYSGGNRPAGYDRIWNPGDGRAATQPNPQDFAVDYRYPDAGVFIATITIINEDRRVSCSQTIRTNVDL